MSYKVGVFFGGRSAEHDVSILSTRRVLEKIDRSKYDVIPIGIDREGLWHLTDENLNFRNGLSFFEACRLILPEIDVAFPLIHGPCGEDGTLQGLFEIAEIPYVGADVLGSAIGLDKDVMKRLLRDAKIPIAKFLVFREPPLYEEVIDELGLPCFIKSANMGSSISLTKVTCKEEFIEGVELAFQYDAKIIIEEEIWGREFECSVLGLAPPIASLPAEIIVEGKALFTYKNKYTENAETQFIIPAQLDVEKMREMQQLALKTFQILCTSSMARVDFFLDEREKIYVNEINTIPGFTKRSRFPKLWEVSGISYPNLLNHLIELALLKTRNKIAKAVGQRELSIGNKGV